MQKIAKFDLLVAIYIFCIAAAELMGAKTFPLFKIFDYQLNASVAILVLPLIFTINDMISEVYGKARAKSVVRSGLIVVFLIFLFTLIATHLPPSVRFSGSEAAYDKIFGFSARIAAASLIAFAFAEFLDVYIFAKIRQKLGTSKLWLRNNASNFISQFVDTTVFMFLAFYALDKGLGNNVGFLFSLILPYWLLKCTMSIIETPLVYAGVRWLKGDTSTPDAHYSRDGVVA
ncbi:MAG: queuosine precursor transporter [Patescibacteria group bacterium]